jgi:hypothetical protein
MSLSSLQVEAVLDLLDQARQAPAATHQATAQEVVVALARSLENSGIIKGASETSAPSEEEPAAKELEQRMKRVAQ